MHTQIIGPKLKKYLLTLGIANPYLKQFFDENVYVCGKKLVKIDMNLLFMLFFSCRTASLSWKPLKQVSKQLRSQLV